MTVETTDEAKSSFLTMQFDVYHVEGVVSVSIVLNSRFKSACMEAYPHMNGYV